MSKPAILIASKSAEAVTANSKPIRNWIKILFCLPKIKPEITEDNTNIHANEHIKTATETLELSVEDKKGTDWAMVVRAVCVKIW
jgi:hypothetical protein